MAEGIRELDGELVKARLKEGGDLHTLLEHILNIEKEYLRLEIRQNSKAIVYYKKNKILEIKLGNKNNPLDVSKRWATLPCKKGQEKGKGDKNPKEPPNLEEAIKNPQNYFNKMKECIDYWLSKKKNQEFAIQQEIAKYNSNSNSDYIIIDMEYSQSQGEKILKTLKLEGIISKKDENGKVITDKNGEPIKLTPRYDLLGIDKKTGTIILFEVKKGETALKNNSGIKEHIRDFEACFRGKEKRFSTILKKDIEGIINSKKNLGIPIPIEINSINYEDIKFMFIFDPIDEWDKFEKEFKRQVENPTARKNYKIICVNSKEKDYILSKDKIREVNGDPKK